jgi:hypothetical protein
MSDGVEARNSHEKECSVTTFLIQASIPQRRGAAAEVRVGYWGHGSPSARLAYNFPEMMELPLAGDLSGFECSRAFLI